MSSHSTKAQRHGVQYHQANAHPEPQSGHIERVSSSMSGNYHGRPRLSATFIPGRGDDFYAPEIISPAPQRIMPEVPSNMQEQLSHLELESRHPTAHRSSIASTVSGMQSPSYLDQGRREYGQPNQQQNQRGPGFTASYEHTNASAYQNIDRDGAQSGGRRPEIDSPKFSPFPKPRDAGPNVPFSDEEKEEVLERARPEVLLSTDPEMQLAWAQDALSWVEVASECAVRLQQEGLPARSVTPRIEHSLRVDAINIVSFLADQHHPKAEFMKSMWLEFGKFGYRVDKKEAFLGYKRAAEKGYARAEYRIGMQFESSNNSSKAIEHYNRGVAMGDSAAHYRLGMMTLLGQHGMPQDYGRGVDLVRFSADTADENAPQGAYVYGMLLARELPNISVPEQFLPYDLNDAKLFIEKAAYLGFAKAQLKMAQAYELCQLGCEFEPALSLHYNALAARQGEAEADMAISKWFLCGYEGIFDKNEELAYTYAKRAALTKMATAEFAMGYFYEIGMYVPVDLQESAMWYQKASDHGNKDALGRIDSIRKNSTLSKSDHQQVAINRIKSQHGSQRGARPDRFKQRGAPMPSISDDTMDMPDPSNKYDPVTGQLKSRNPLPARPVSVAPYPEDDIAHPRGGYSQPNPPFNGQGLRPHSREAPLADKPSSTFGIKPQTHSNTGFDEGRGRGYEPIRPSTSTGNMTVPTGRGQGRSASAGWESQAPGGAGYRQSEQSQQGFLPPVDMGPPVNFEQAGSRLQKAQPQGYGADSRSQTPQGYGNRPTDPTQRQNPAAGRPPRGSSMATGPPPPNGPTINQNYPSKNSPTYPPSTSSRGSQRPPPQHTMSSQSAPPQHTMSSRPDSRSSSVAPSVASMPPPAAAKPKPAGKSGPATFEEMGIPAGKTESDCSIM